MALEWRRGPGIGRTEVFEDGVQIGYTQQNQFGEGALDIRRAECCNVHDWYAVTVWTTGEPFPGDKSPDHWRKLH